MAYDPLQSMLLLQVAVVAGASRTEKPSEQDLYNYAAPWVQTSNIKCLRNNTIFGSVFRSAIGTGTASPMNFAN